MNSTNHEAIERLGHYQPMLQVMISTVLEAIEWPIHFSRLQPYVQLEIFMFQPLLQQRMLA
jgi:ribosomal protein S16